MTGKLKIEISESIETLSTLLKQEKNLKRKERIQALYWIKSNLVKTIANLAALSGKHRTTVSRWLSSYREGGLQKMLDIYTSSGRKPEIPPEIQQVLINELTEKEGFSSYKVVHDTVRYRLKAKLKVPIKEINIRILDIGYKMNPDLDYIL